MLQLLLLLFFYICNQVQNVKRACFRKQHSERERKKLDRSIQNSIRRVLFKIGVVGENVHKILNHSVAEVVLLLEGKAEWESVTVRKGFPTQISLMNYEL